MGGCTGFQNKDQLVLAAVSAPCGGTCIPPRFVRFGQACPEALVFFLVVAITALLKWAPQPGPYKENRDGDACCIAASGPPWQGSVCSESDLIRLIKSAQIEQ